MNDDHKTDQERLKEIVESHHQAITCLICLMRKRIEMEAEFWIDLMKCVNEVK